MVGGSASGVEEKSEVRSASGRYKYQRLRDRLRDAIKQGELAGKLPGERELARRYDANAKTINKALSDLSTEGLLIRHVGRGTFVANGTNGDALQKKICTYGWLMPGGTNHSYRHEIYRQVEEQIRNKGHRLEKILSPADDSGELPDGMLTAGQLRGWDGVILYAARPSADLLADLHRRHLPLVMTNNLHEHIRTTTVLPDYAQGAFELCQHLIHLGHREIQLLITPEMLPGAIPSESGYRAAMNRHGMRPRPQLIVGMDFDWHGMMSGTNRVTALICVGAALAIRASHQAAEKGLTLPSMLSVSALPEPGESILTDQSITAYEVEPANIVRWTTELLLSASPGQPPRTVIVPGRFKDRGSAAPPIAGARQMPNPPTDAVM